MALILARANPLRSGPRPATKRYPQFPQVYPQPATRRRRIDARSTHPTALRLWITPRGFHVAIDGSGGTLSEFLTRASRRAASPVWEMSQPIRPADHRPGPSGRRRSAARPPSSPAKRCWSATRFPLNFPAGSPRGYDRDHWSSCDSSHWGRVGREGRRHPMTTQPIGPQSAGSSSRWYTDSPTCNRSYLLAGLRAGLIALVLLAILALIVWF